MEAGQIIRNCFRKGREVKVYSKAYPFFYSRVLSPKLLSEFRLNLVLMIYIKIFLTKLVLFISVQYNPYLVHDIK